MLAATPTFAQAPPSEEAPPDDQFVIVDANAAPEDMPPAQAAPEVSPDMDARDAPAPAAAPPTPASPPADDDTEVLVLGVPTRSLAGSSQVIGEEQLKRNEYDDPHRVLLQVPGVYVRGEDGYGLRPNIGIRGANSDRSKKITLMEDGVLFAPAPYSAPAAYYFPVMTRMRSVRVVKGPAAIAHGPQTIAGAVDLRTRSIPATTRGAVDVAGGQYGYGKLHAWAGSSNDQMGFLVEGVHWRSDGIKRVDGGGDTGFYRNELMFKGGYELDPRADVQHRFELKLGYSNETSHETYLGLTQQDFRDRAYRRYRASANARMHWNRTQIALMHHARFTRELTLETTVYRNDFERSWRKLAAFENGPPLIEVLRDPNSGINRVFYDVLTGEQDTASDGEKLRIGPNDRDFVSQGVQTVVRWRPRTGPVAHQIEYGLRLHNDGIRRLHWQDAYLMLDGELVRDTSEPRSVSTDNGARTSALAMHVFDAATLGHLTLTPGVRVEVIRWTFDDDLGGTGTGDSYAIALPGIGAFYALPADFGVLAGVYRGFSPVAPGPVPDATRPETSINYEAGTRWSPGRSRFEVIGFYNDYQNLTDVCTFSNGCLDQNLDRQFDAGEARVWGVEGHLQHTFETSIDLEFPLIGSYTFTVAELTNDFSSDDPQFGDVEAGDELPYVPRHQGSLTVGAEAPRWGLHATGTYVDDMRERAGRGPEEPFFETDAFFTLDVGGQLALTKHAQVYTNVRNVLDEHYVASHRPFGARPGARRWVQVGFRYEL